MTLILVYNANSGKLNALISAGHKLLSPSTYECQLCTLTHNTFIENKLWKTFRETTDIKMTFYHIDEFEKALPNHSFNYPVILKKEKEVLTILISSNEFKNIKNIEGLIATIKAIDV